MDLDFTDDELTRYSRNILLADVGATGQAKLRAARVLVVGAGGLGSPLILYLAAAGVGRITVADDDAVELSNLNRQILHATRGVGLGKAVSAAAGAAALNPEVAISVHPARVTAADAGTLIAAHDVVCDGSDNFETRFLLADAAWRAGKPLVSAAILRWDGQLGVFGPGGPCFRCLHAEAPPDGLTPTCAQAGVMGTTTGILGTLQANEAIKLILGVGATLLGRLLIWDGLRARMRTIAVPRDPACGFCSHE